MKTIIAAVCMAIGIFLLLKGLSTPILTGPGGGMFMLGLALYQGASILRCIGAGVLAACSTFWLPGLIAGAKGVELLWLIAFVFAGFSIRVGLMNRGTA